MKIIKIIFLTFLTYVIFVFGCFQSLNTPVYKINGMEDINQEVPVGRENAITATLNDFIPGISYELNIYLDKQNSSAFSIYEGKNLLYKDNSVKTESLANKITALKNKKGINLTIYEIPGRKTEKELKYEKDLEELRQSFYQKVTTDINDDKASQIGKDLSLIASDGPYPGQETLGPVPQALKKTYIKKIIAIAPKNKENFITVNRIIYQSMLKYLSSDLYFKIGYFLIISCLIWIVLKLKKYQ